MKPDQIEKHATTQSILLHLLPGILVGGFYFLARQPVARLGYPSVVALILAFAFILIPIELGYLFYQGKIKTGRFTIQGIISYREAIPWWQYLIWVFLQVMYPQGSLYPGLQCGMLVAFTLVALCYVISLMLTLAKIPMANI